MASFEFYINDDQREELINLILSNGTTIIPDILYDSKDYIAINNVDEYINHINNETVRFFLINEKFRKESIDFLKIDFDDGSKFKISQRVGGPYIDLVFYLGYSMDSKIPYKINIIDFYQKFIHINSNEEFIAPLELKNYYKKIVTFIKNRTIKIKIDNKHYWMSKEVLEEIKFKTKGRCP